MALFAGAGAWIVYGALAGTLALPMIDATVYLHAAEHLRDGEALYSAAPATSAYRYAPWFAAAWVPLTVLPLNLVAAAWASVLAAASWYLLRRVPLPGLVLFAPLLFLPVYSGNVHPLILAGLVYGLPRRSGPLFVALAASLKGSPILFVLWYLGRREWAKAAWTVGLAALLLAPMLLFDLTHFNTTPGFTLSLYGFSPLLWAAIAAMASASALVLARGRYGLVGAATAALAALPRTEWYDVGYLLVPLRDDHELG